MTPVILRRTVDGQFIHRNDLCCNSLSHALRFDTVASAQEHVRKWMGVGASYEVVPAINPPAWTRSRWEWE